jgi:hypothetical protein
MGSNPINLAVRFLLELSVLLAMGMWGWKLSDHWMRLILALAIPVLAMIIWGVFAVPEDPSRSGIAPVPIPGGIRLLIELTFFGIGSWMFYDLGYTKVGLTTAIVVVIHYVISYDRIVWLLSN